jgi:Arc/MetJ-type ribon-helix-helix transcriptional regulator
MARQAKADKARDRRVTRIPSRSPDTSAAASGVLPVDLRELLLADAPGPFSATTSALGGSPRRRWYHGAMANGTGAQIAVRLPKEALDQLDALVDSGRFSSRAEVARTAIAELLDNERRRAVGDAIAEGYRRLPQTEEELAGAEANARAMILEEPW